MRAVPMLVIALLRCTVAGVLVFGAGTQHAAWAQDSESPADDEASEPTKQEVAVPSEEATDASATEGEPTVDASDDSATSGAEEAEGAPSEDGAAPGASTPSNQGSSFNLQLRDLEERVNTLKERVFQSKARLRQLQEVVLYGAITGAKAVLVHRNEMGSSFKLHRVQYSLDGSPIFNRSDSGDGALDEQKEIEIFNGAIAPGNHQISVFLEYTGDGFGVFSYLQNYTFKIKSSYTFTAEEGKLTTVNIVGYEQGGFTTELKDRPAVRYDQKVENAKRDSTKAKAGK